MNTTTSNTIKDLLDTVFSLLDEQELGSALTAMENLLYTYPQLYSNEQLLRLREEYQLLADYWRRGYADPQRTAVYDALLHRLFSLATDVAVVAHMKSTPLLTTVYNRTRRSNRDWSIASVRQQLENFVAEAAMLDLSLDNQPTSHGHNAQQLYSDHQQLMADLFDYVWTSTSWNESLEQAFADILLSPTLDSVDQQLLVSALMLSAMTVFDPSKLRLLMRVYDEAEDQRVRQRALVAWVFSLGGTPLRLFPDIASQVESLIAKEDCRRELSELQMQLFFCISAEADTKKIQSEIMPNLMSNSTYRVTRNGIEETEEDPMQDILDPEASERSMERMEQSVRRMMDMQQAGSDIYFGGFSQMKRYPFFQSVSNWFVPFYAHHPAVSKLLDTGRGRKFLRTMVEQGPFCDSDKYSFVLAFEQVAARIPDSLMQLLDSGEAQMVGAQLQAGDISKPAYIRRMYLQSLYRFFRIHPQRADFHNPFLKSEDYLFLTKPVFLSPLLADNHLEVASFLYKRRQFDDCAALVRAYCGQPSLRYCLLKGNVSLALTAATDDATTANEAVALAADSFEEALRLSPDDVQALAGLGRARFRQGSHERALECYKRLLDQQPDKRSYKLNAAVCLLRLGRHDEALPTLYQLSYEQPDDHNVSRVLAWAQVCAGKYEQAAKAYQQLLQQDQPMADDQLNYGYCLWLSSQVDGAIAMFRQYAAQSGGKTALRHEFFGDGYDLLRRAAVSDQEIRLMLDHAG